MGGGRGVMGLTGCDVELGVLLGVLPDGLFGHDLGREVDVEVVAGFGQHFFAGDFAPV